MNDLKDEVLKWQRIPEHLWESFVLATPSDAGTGAVVSAVEIALKLQDDLNTIGVEELGWPAYAAIARSCRVGFKEFPTDCVIHEQHLLPIYQAGPMNTTGRVTAESVLADRAKSAAESNRLVILDRAYSGFEFAKRLQDDGYDAIMRMSYEKQIAPFIEHGAPHLIAISPTKCFRSFALRPAGLLLAFLPDESKRKEVTTVANALMRARGCSFEHPITRAFIKAMVNDRESLEGEQATVLQRVADTELAWEALSQDTSIESLFSENYSGLFRNPSAREGADVAIFGDHIYPVFSNGRCRINVTGLPEDEQLQRKHVSAFAAGCLPEDS